MPDQVLKFDEEAIHIPAGPLTDGTQQRIEKAVGLSIPDGKHIAVLAMIDGATNRPIAGSFGVAVRVGEHWKLTAEAKHTFGGATSGFAGIVGVF
jgi:hypothetical protein